VRNRRRVRETGLQYETDGQLYWGTRRVREIGGTNFPLREKFSFHPRRRFQNNFRPFEFSVVTVIQKLKTNNLP
jgi:hypothetical protein